MTIIIWYVASPTLVELWCIIWQFFTDWFKVDGLFCFLKNMLILGQKCFRAHNRTDIIKGGFFSESKIRFSNLPISQKHYSKKRSWAWNLNKLFTDMGRSFKFKAQDSFLE